MRILLDESLPRRLIRELPGHIISTVTDNGWSGLENDLLRAAAGQFDLFLSADQNIEYQQNLRDLPMTVVVLVAANNRLDTLRPFLPEVLERLGRLEPCTLVKVGG